MKKNRLIKFYIKRDMLEIENVIDDFTPYLYTVIRNKNSNLLEEDIEEIISDVFLAVWKNQDKLDRSKDMSSYLAGIAKNIYNTKMRNKKQTSDISDYENILYEKETIECKIEDFEKSSFILQEIEKMKEEDKCIFISYYYYAESMNQIDLKLHIKAEKVKSRLFIIRKKLKKELEKRGHGYGK